MKIFNFGGVVFNADNVCTIQKINLKGEEKDKDSGESILKTLPGVQIVTVAGGVNFSFEDEKDRNTKFETLKNELKEL